MLQKYLELDISIGRQKPESIVNKETKCPFCDHGELTEILDRENEILLVKNKYPVLQRTFQTVLIETDQCGSEFSEYTGGHLHRVIRFGIKHWLQMCASKQYASVLFFKNHGPLSGGTIRHPHMQIVGLEEVDYHAYIEESQFHGIVIDQKNNVELNVSTQPRIGFTEFNIIMLANNEPIDQMADYIQRTAHFLLHNFNEKCQSYNLFFYLLDEKIRVKAVPRFPTSPLYIGYGLPQISNHLPTVVEKFKKLYFGDSRPPQNNI